MKWDTLCNGVNHIMGVHYGAGCIIGRGVLGSGVHYVTGYIM